MAEKRDIANTLGDTKFGTSLRPDVKSGDLSDGYFNASPDGNYEGSLDSDTYWEIDDDGNMKEFSAGTRHAGHIEADGFRSPHGNNDEYGFVRRPLHGSDVERT